MAWYGHITVQLHGRSPIRLETRYVELHTPEEVKSRQQTDTHGRKIVLTKKEHSHFRTLVKKLLKRPNRACCSGAGANDDY